MKIDYILNQEYKDQPWICVGDGNTYDEMCWGKNECWVKFGMQIDSESNIPKPTKEHLQKLWDDKYELEYLNSIIANKRKVEYPTMDELIVALWEKIVEDKSDLLNQIQERRQLVKDAYPKLTSVEKPELEVKDVEPTGEPVAEIESIPVEERSVES